MFPAVAEIPSYMALPFVLMLLSIAVFPLWKPHWWEPNGHKLIVSAALGIPTLIYLIAAGLTDQAIHAVVFDYIPFIVLLGSLFTISGGILLTGDLEATPRINTIFLGVGAVLANLIGTTGAAMLLLRPLIRTNSERRHVAHTIIFFIFLVANIGGCLTPLGDPPLFLGYLRGVPFEWTLRLWSEWLFAVVSLLAIYCAWDMRKYRQEPQASLAEDRSRVVPLALHGKVNLIWLSGVVLCVAFLNANYIPAIRANHLLGFAREAAMLALAGLSLASTPKGLRKENRFSFGPIVEVACLFIGIFVTMVPSLMLLETHGRALGLTRPWQFFWCAGGLSSFLDNAPTYVTFFTAAIGLNVDQAAALAGQAAPRGFLWVKENLIDQKILAAISLGAVFMGANTYIGNGPNFMVKAVAEESGIKMPSFFGYMAYSCLILLPLFGLITALFIL